MLARVFPKFRDDGRGRIAFRCSRYNARVSPKARARRAETLGLIVIALLIAALTLARFGTTVLRHWR